MSSCCETLCRNVMLIYFVLLEVDQLQVRNYFCNERNKKRREETSFSLKATISHREVFFAKNNFFRSRKKKSPSHFRLCQTSAVLNFRSVRKQFRSRKLQLKRALDTPSGRAQTIRCYRIESNLTKRAQECC